LPPIVYAVDQDAQAIAQATALADQWRRVLGVQVKLVQASTHAAYDKILDKKAYQISVIDWTADFPDPSNFLSQQFHTGSPNNNGSYSNQTFDRLVDRADRMTPPQNPARLALYHRAESIAMAQAAAVPLVNPYVGIMLRQGIHGLQISGGQVLTHNWAQVTANQGSSS
jgi:ABC-type oligopeptide transport system substrate-binding subunit